MTDFAGSWLTTFGPMTLERSGNRVSGTYQMGPDLCTINGTIQGDRLEFTYREPTCTGVGWFELKRYGKFVGRWRQDGTDRWLPWTGERGFDGLWKTSFGRMRLFHEDDHVHGCYNGPGHSTVHGSISNERLRLEYEEPAARGEAEFMLLPDQIAFDGRWRQAGTSAWLPWQGKRVFPIPEAQWLVVVESQWQVSLNEPDYAFGNMLREFFARVANVQVRQRFFTDSEGLEHSCRDLAYLAEPTALVIATHGEADVIRTRGRQAVSPDVLARSLAYVENLSLIHFSSCLTLQDGENSPFYQHLHGIAPISGYATTVDWAASAMIEFFYLDMVLSKYLTPDEAARQVFSQLAFAGDTVPDGSPYPPARFRFFAG